MFTIESFLLCENLGLLGALLFWLLQKMLKGGRCMNKFVANGIPNNVFKFVDGDGAFPSRILRGPQDADHSPH